MLSSSNPSLFDCHLLICGVGIPIYLSGCFARSRYYQVKLHRSEYLDKRILLTLVSVGERSIRFEAQPPVGVRIVQLQSIL